MTDSPREPGTDTWVRYILDVEERCSAVTWQERRIAIANHVICIRFSCSQLAAKLFPALAHNETNAPAVAGLTINVWDSAASGIPLPAPPFSSRLATKGQLAESHGDRILAAYEVASAGLSVLDRARGVGLYHVPDAARIPSFEIAFPLRTILNGWLGGLGLQLVHAGAVGTEHGGVLLTGRGGSGKSNTCLACLDAGFLYAGDDYIAAEPGAAPRVHSLFSSAKLHAADLGHFPGLASALAHASTREDEKSVLFLHRCMPAACARALPIRAILLPRVTGRPDTRMTPVPRAQSLKAMAPTTMFQLAGAGRGEFHAMARLAAQVPSYALELGTDRTRIPDVIREFLAAHAPAPSKPRPIGTRRSPKGGYCIGHDAVSGLEPVS